MAKGRKRSERADYGKGSIYPNKDGSFTVAVRLKPGEKPTRRRAADEQSAEVVRQALIKLRERGIVEDGEALDAALEILERLRSDEIDVDGATMRFDVFINKWFNEVVKVRKGITERTLEHYRGTIRRYLIPYFGAHSLIQIKAPPINSFLNSLRTHLAESTVRHVYSTLRQSLDTAVAWRYLSHNPCAGVERPRVKKEEKPALTVEQVRALFAVVESHPTAPIWHVMATLGTRLGETLALRRIDFNDDFSQVWVMTQISYHSLERTAPKYGSKRPLPVPPRLRERLVKQWGLVSDVVDFQNGGLLFPSEVGTPFQPSNVEKVWNGYTQRRKTKKGRKEYIHQGFKERAGLPGWATIHSLRDFVATTLEDIDEVEERTIGHILGHGAKNITGKYIKRYMPTMRRALEKLEGVLWEGAREERTG